jgi:crotonobetainyl-CoA:carnitine CoA-transferase CaiB-like acyl-CoA transferase
MTRSDPQSVSPATQFRTENRLACLTPGPDEVLPSAFRVTELATQSIAAATLAVAAFDRQRTGREQEVTVDRSAAALAFRSEWSLRIGGDPPPSPWGPIAGTYPTADDGWVQIHANFPHHEAGALAVLGLTEPDRDAVAAAVATWKAQDLEDAMAAAGMVASRQRTAEEWYAHPHGQAIEVLDLLDVFQELPSADLEVPEPTSYRPLSGVRVLDLTRVIAGPVAGRFLAAHGAEVLKVDAPHLPQIDALVVETGAGKRSCHLDLRHGPDGDAFLGLLDGADVVIDGYRPGALGGLGLSSEAMMSRRPGLVVVELSAYGSQGPWADRRGFDSLVQTATGITATGQQVFGSERPQPLPCQALDHGSGYLAAFGAVDALRRRAVDGGSWRVRVSLVRTRHWLQRLGPGDPSAVAPEVPEDLLVDFDGITLMRPPGALSETPPFWASGPVPLGSDEPRWPG